MSFRGRSFLRFNLFVVLIVVFGLFAASLHAQEDKGETKETSKWKRKPAFSLRLGSYFPSLETNLRVDSEALGRGTEINLENLLRLNKSPIVLRADAEIRVASWLSFDLGYYGIGRSKTTVIDRDIQVGDTIFNLNQTLQTKFNTNYIRANLKFFFVHSPRLDLGVWAGANVAFYKFSLDAQGAGNASIERNDVWAPIPAAGIHLSYTLLPNLYLFGKAGYFYYSLSDNFKFTSTSFDINLNYYFLKFLGIGATYEYNVFKLDGEVGGFSGKISSRFGGFQIYGILGF
jgi:hypothetical protein